MTAAMLARLGWSWGGRVRRNAVVNGAGVTEEDVLAQKCADRYAFLVISLWSERGSWFEERARRGLRLFVYPVAETEHLAGARAAREVAFKGRTRRFIGATTSSPLGTAGAV